MVFPGYTSDKPFLQPIRDLKNELGLNDSCIQSTEVAIRHLIESSKKSEKSTTQFIRDLSESFSISHGVDDFNELFEKSSKSYIVQTYNVLELFFRKLIEEYCQHKSIRTENWERQRGNENLDLFNQFLHNLNSDKKSFLAKVPESKLIEYYRLVRVSIIHKTPKTTSKAENYYNKVIKPLQSHFSGYNMQAPNSPEKISYDDFVIYTRAIKYYSKLINEACDINADDILRVAKENIDLKRSTKRKYEKSSPRTISKVIKILRLYYLHNYGGNDIHLKEFTQKYLNYLGISEFVYIDYL